MIKPLPTGRNNTKDRRFAVYVGGSRGFGFAEGIVVEKYLISLYHDSMKRDVSLSQNVQNDYGDGSVFCNPN